METTLRNDLYAHLQRLPVELPRRLAVRPAAVAGDLRPQRDPPVPVVRPDLPRHQHRHLRHRGRAAAAPLLAAGRSWSRSAPSRCSGSACASPSATTRSSRADAGRAGRRRHAGRGDRPAASGSSRRSGAATTWPASSTRGRRRLHDTARGQDRDWSRPPGPGSTWCRTLTLAIALVGGAIAVVAGQHHARRAGRVRRRCS